MYLLKILVALVAVLFAVSLAAPAAEVSPQTSRAPAPSEAPAPIPDFSTPLNGPDVLPLADSTDTAECGDSTFVDQTSEASPRVDDCLVIVKNIAGGGRWEIEALIGQQHQLVQWGTCAFGVQRAVVGAPYFYVGNEDIIYAIMSSIEKFGSSGLVGSKGYMRCSPNFLSPGCNWGLYHTKSFLPRDAPNDMVSALTTPTNDFQAVSFLPSDVKEDDCGASDFVDQTNGGSPLVDDCLVIVKNIASNGRWNVEAVFGDQHQLVQWGTCAFGVQGKSSSAGSYYVGNGDIIDIIQSSIEMFGSSGVVAAKGSMQCNGQLSRSVNVAWGIYHTKIAKPRSVLPREISAGITPRDTPDPALPTPANDTSPIPDITTPGNDTQPATFVRDDQAGAQDHRCWNVLFGDQTADWSPEIDDCLVIAKNIASGGMWNVEAFVCKSHQLVQYGTCAFGVRAECRRGSNHDWFFHVGNQDIIDIINQSVDLFGSNGRVGATGSMSCQAVAMPPRVDWGLYHTKDLRLEQRQMASAGSGPRAIPDLPAPAVVTSPILDRTTPTNDQQPSIFSGGDEGTSVALTPRDSYDQPYPNNTAAAGLPAPNTTLPCPVFSTPTNDTHRPVFLASPADPQQAAADGNNECGDSTFENQISAASPLIDDCLRIATNIGKGGKWEVESTAKDQHQLVQYGTCALGVQGLDGIAFFFYVGNQDIIDLIHESIRMYGFDGRVQTAGEMQCSSGISKPPTVGWGIYHTK